ncbi:MAG: Zn-dependent hydrolase [Flavobacteriaceae bacterium]|jgi:N-carbamoyl-L-amino-acid hydrolase|nr:Zn-dependent hydrolase [Flavobacteriaceae bacterium]MBQ22712.1 Zn-dependent hydrolase [Flavobacteriales bacterium]|tara:strand:+ start:277 stop:1563 length:1287 start_codon:yes stop_codon:yes gene_type:complete
MKKLFTLYVLIFNYCQSQQVNVNQNRIQANWEKLKEFGVNQSTNGNDRIAFSDFNVEALEYLKNKLIALGLETKIDAAGNLIATKKGKNKSFKPIGFGSHIDAVPNGGHYDGQIGVLAAIECIETMIENDIITSHPLELIIFSNEEGGVFGSRALAGSLTKESLEVITASGLTNSQGIIKLGGDPNNALKIAREPQSLHAFIELHIEQGSILFDEDIEIGIVEGIVGLRWWDVEIKGFSNHAGTTPMNKRKDAMLAAAKFILEVNNIVKSISGTQVGTVGRIKSFPGAPNVIPGKVILSLELRDLNENKLDSIYTLIENQSKHIGNDTDTQFSFTPISATGKAALTDPIIQKIIQNQAHKLKLNTKVMPSGAGHDAQEMTHIAPTGMIFIPSRDGISHSPDEFSSMNDIKNGTQVLLETILVIDKTDF